MKYTVDIEIKDRLTGKPVSPKQLKEMLKIFSLSPERYEVKNVFERKIQESYQNYLNLKSFIDRHASDLTKGGKVR